MLAGSVVTFVSLLAGLVAAEEDAIHVPLTRRDAGFKGKDGSASLLAIRDQASRTSLKYYRNAKHLREKRGVKPSHERILRGRGLIDLEIESYCVWSGQITVGTPPQSFSMFFDSGSNDLTIPSSLCSDDNCGSKARYNANASTSAVRGGDDVVSNFADGSSSKGAWIRDKVTAGGLTSVQSIVAATELSATIKSLDSDGLMGMAWSGLSATGSPSFPFTLYSAKKGNTFAIRLSDDDNISEVSIGSFNRRKFSGQVTWFPVATTTGAKVKTYWQTANGMPLLNGKAALAKRPNFIIDSGTTFIIAPLASAGEFYAAIEGSAKLDDNHWTFPCDSQPTLGFRFSSTSKKEFQISPDDFNLGYLSEDESRCVGAVVGQDLGLGTSWILGASFIKSWYSIFDMANSRIGFATPN